MATLNQVIKEGTAQGVSKSEIPQLVKEWGDSYGFDAEPAEFDPIYALKYAQKDLMNTLTDNDASLVRNVLSDDEILQKQNKLFAETRDNMFYTDDVYNKLLTIEYDKLSPAQILNENNKITNYEPWLTVSKDRTATFKEGALSFTSNLINTGISAFNGLQKIGLDLITQESPLTKFIPTPYSIGKLTGVIEDDNVLTQTREKYYQFLNRTSHAQKEFFEGDIPDYIRNQKGYQIAGAFGQLPQIALGLVPVAGPALLTSSIAGRYYDEAMQESGGNTNVATLYTSVFGTLGFAIDRLTLGTGKNLLLKMKPQSRKEFIMKSVGVVAPQSIKIGAFEYITETAESAFLQKATKDTINWKQARFEGMLAFLVGATGGTITGGVRAAMGVKQLDQLVDMGVEEDLAAEFVDNVKQGNKEAAEENNVKMTEQILENFKEFNIQDNIQQGVYKKYTLAEIKRINRNKNNTQLEQEADKQDPRWRNEVYNALLNPNEQTVEALNKKIEEEVLKDQANTEVTEEVKEVEPQTFTVYRTKKDTATVKATAGNVLGDAEYYTFTEKDAASYTQGVTENVESAEITVNNPYIIGESADIFDADMDFADLLKAAETAGYKFSDIYGSEESDGITLQEYLKSIGHDSLIIKNIQGANKNPSMFRIFGVMADISGTGKPVQVTDGSQIIVFNKKVTKENKLLEVQEKYLNELSFVELKEIAKVYDIEGVKLKKDIISKLKEKLSQEEIITLLKGNQLFPDSDTTKKYFDNKNLDTMANLMAMNSLMGSYDFFDYRLNLSEEMLNKTSDPLFTQEVNRRMQVFRNDMAKNGYYSQDFIPPLLDNTVVGLDIIIDNIAQSRDGKAFTNEEIKNGEKQKRFNEIVQEIMPILSYGTSADVLNATIKLGITDNHNIDFVMNMSKNLQILRQAKVNGSLEVFEEFNATLNAKEITPKKVYERGKTRVKLVTKNNPNVIETNKEYGEILNFLKSSAFDDNNLLTPELQRVKRISDEMVANIKETLPTFDRKLSAEEQEQFINYILYKQGYTERVTGVDEQGNEVKETIEPISENDLQQDLRDYINAARQQFDSLAEQFDTVKTILEKDYTKLDWYFPLRRKYDVNKVNNTTDLNQLKDIATQIFTSRTGNTVGIEPDPVFQVETTIKFYALSINIGKEMQGNLEKVKNNIEDVAKAQNKIKNDRPLTDEEQRALEAYIELQNLQSFASDEKISSVRLPEANPLLLDLVNDHIENDVNNDTADLPPLGNLDWIPNETLKNAAKKVAQGWTNVVDPHFIVQRMDKLKTKTMVDKDGNKVEMPSFRKNGRFYGSNSTLWALVLKAGAKARRADIKEQNFQTRLLRNYKGKDLDRINKVLDTVFMGENDVKNVIKRSKTPNDLYKNLQQFIRNNPSRQKDLGSISKEDTEVVFYFGKKLQEHFNLKALSEETIGDLSFIAKEKRKRFFELDRKLSDDNYNPTEQELFEYKAFGGTNNELVNQSIMRKFTRRMFEKKAIDERDFLGWYNASLSNSNKALELQPIIKLIDSWADYLESIGQTTNAQWWRTKANINLRGQIFKFEDTILNFIASRTKASINTVFGEQMTGSTLDAVRNATQDEIKLGIVDGFGWLQRARINAFLLGNIGWNITTQPSSYAFVIKQVGFKKALEQLKINTELDERIIDDSDVIGLKSGSKDITGLEAADYFREQEIFRSKRQTFRNILGSVGSFVERHLTTKAFNAGYTYGKDVYGFGETDAIIHGDMVAATTQSMYDRVSRNSALNSTLLKFFRPMQSYVFTAYSNVLDTFGVVGIERDAATRGAEAAKWILASRMWTILWSMIFGDDLLKAIYNPQFSKSTVGSAIPLFGLQVDIAMTKTFPWLDDAGWKGDEPSEQWVKQTTRIINAAATGADNFERELMIYTFRYITPALGIGGAVPLQNLTKLVSAKINGNSFEDINGKEMDDFVYDNPIGWAAGVAFGRKAVDTREND